MKAGLLWKSILGEIELNVSPAVYATWFQKTKLLAHNTEEFVVGVPNAFAQRQLETQFKPLIKQALSKNQVNHQTLRYRIFTQTKIKDDLQPANTASKNHHLWARDYRIGLNAKYTFENFIPGSGNDLAYAAARAVADNLGSKYNPLFVYGGVGIGKTHLIQAIGNETSRQNPGLRILYITFEQFVQEFTDAIRYKKHGEFTSRYRQNDVLIIDDIQFIANKEKTQEEFFHTFNVLHEAGKQIIISSDKPPHSIATLEERLKSRFQMGMAIDMQIPDFETRCAILKYKADQMNLKIENECVEFLAHNISTNIRILEGALNHLGIFCETHHISLGTLQLAERIFGEQFKKAPKNRLTAKQIIEKTAQYFSIGVPDIMSPKRDQEIVLPRQVSMYLMRQDLQLSFPKIAKNLNRKDHTTAIHSIAKITKKLGLDQELRDGLEKIRENLAT